MTDTLQSGVPWYREMTRYQWLVLVVAWLGWVFDIMDTALFNLAKVPMMQELVGSEQYKLVGAAIEGKIQMALLIGWALGGLVFGILADRWGRTRTMILTILLYCALTGLTALCQTWQQVLAARFLTGLGIGGEWAAGAALIAEVVPNRARAGAAALLQSAAAFGPVFAALFNLALANSNWRWLFVVGIGPALITVIIRTKVKEPEKWSHDPRPKGSLSELFGVAIWRRNVIVACILGVVGISGAGAITYWLPNLVKAASPGMEASDVQARQSYALFILHAGTLLGVLFFPWLCERIGRRKALGLFFILAPLTLLATLYGGATWGRLAPMLPLLSFCAIGLSAGFALYFPELFPSRLRATGSGFAYNVGRIASAPIPWLTGVVIGAYSGVAWIGVALSAVLYAPGLVALAFAPETKGMPLPED